MAKHAARIEHREEALDKLRLDAQNVKLHTEAQIEQLCASIVRFGFRDPIGITPEGLILEGHGRYEAAKRLGMQTVPVFVVHGLNRKEQRAYAIAHNQTTQNTGLDADIVREEFGRLGVSDADYLSLGYNRDDVLFLGDEFATGVSTDTDHNGHAKEDLKRFMPPVLRSVLHFQNGDEFAVWNRLVETCRSRYLTGATIAERLIAFVDEFPTETSHGH